MSFTDLTLDRLLSEQLDAGQVPATGLVSNTAAALVLEMAVDLAWQRKVRQLDLSPSFAPK